MAKKSSITQDMAEYWAALHEQGLSTREIAAKVGYGKTTVAKQLEKIGALRKKRFPSAKEVDEWVDAYKAGTSPYDLSEQHGFNDETIRTHLKARGVKMRAPGGPIVHPHDQDEEWKRMYLSGRSEREIALAFGVSETTVSTRLRKMKTPMRAGYETNKKVTGNLAKTWAEEYLSGSSSVEIAERYGFTSTTVLEYLHQLGVDVGPIIRDADIAEMKDRYENGETVQELSNSFGITDTYVRVKLKEAGVELREPIRGFAFSDDVLDDWQYRYESGESLASIAFSSGIKSGETVRARLVDRGIKIREKVSTTASSWQEWAIFFYLSKAFPEWSLENNPAIKTSEGIRFPDVTATSQDRTIKIAVEYDGAFWHDREGKRTSDQNKTALLEEAGFTVYRIIENNDDKNLVESKTLIYCTSELSGIDCGLGFAIAALLKMLGSDPSIVDFEKDSAAISNLYYEAKNKTAHGKEWAEQYLSGDSTNKIAKRYGVTPTTVSNSLKLQGIEIRHRPTNEETRKEWLRLFNENLSVPSIAAKCGCDKSVIYRYFKSIGIEFEKHPRRANTNNDEEWKKLYEIERMSLSAIAKQYGTTATTVSSHLKKMGVQIREKSEK